MTENKELILLEDIASIIVDCHDIEKTLARITELIATRMAVDVCTIYFYEEGELVLKATRGLKPSAIESVRMAPGEGLTGKTFESGTPVNVEHADQHPDYKFFPGIGEEAMGSYLGIPLIHRRAPIGVLSVQTKVPRSFSPNEVRMLVAAAGQLGGVITSAQATERDRAFTEQKDNGTGEDAFFRGTSASSGIGQGKLLVMTDDMDLDAIGECPCKSTEEALSRFGEALEKAENDVIELRDRVSQSLSEEDGAIFHAHLLMLQDQALREKVRELIRKGEGPVKAVVTVAHEYIAAFLAIEDQYLRERATDVRDIAQRLLTHLRIESEEQQMVFDEPVVVLANDITPSQAAQIIQPGLKGVALTHGGLNSHTAILCRAANIPAIIALECDPAKVEPGQPAILDGNTGLLYLSPPEPIAAEYGRLAEDSALFNAELLSHVNEPSTTLDGVEVKLQGNAALLSDIPTIKECGAEGIGLYRTEFPFLIRSDLPDEETQYEVYSRAVEGMGGAPVTFRTLDIGGDKPLPYLPLMSEDNPQLGWRSIRMSFDMENIFREQIRAILRASGHGPVRVMFPMITEPQEMREARRIVEEERERVGIPSDVDIPIGAMMEVPSAAILFDQIAPHSDFFSIGTNDLAQYILAVDRGNAKVSGLYDPLHPAVLRTIAAIAKRAKIADRPLGICGELSASAIGATTLIALGLRDFSVTPSALMKIRRLIQCIRAESFSALEEELLQQTSPESVRELVGSVLESSDLPKALLL